MSEEILTQPDAPDGWLAWNAAGMMLAKEHRALERKIELVQFQIGDWINEGEHEFGEMYAQALDIFSHLTYGTLMNYRWVAGSIDPSLRGEVNWSIHKLVAPLPPDEQEKILRHAEEEDLSVQIVKWVIDSARDGAADDPHETCPTCHGDGWVIASKV